MTHPAHRFPVMALAQPIQQQLRVEALGCEDQLDAQALGFFGLRTLFPEVVAGVGIKLLQTFPVLTLTSQAGDEVTCLKRVEFSIFGQVSQRIQALSAPDLAQQFRTPGGKLAQVARLGVAQQLGHQVGKLQNRPDPFLQGFLDFAGFFRTATGAPADFGGVSFQKV